MDEPLWAAALKSICALVSLSASGWLLRSIWHLPRHIQTTLLALQLWHLALADIATYSVFAVRTTHRLVSSVWGFGGFDALCILESAGGLGFLTSTLFETHIALAAMFKAIHLTSGLKALKDWRGFVWCVGILLGALNLYVSHVQHQHWDHNLRQCTGGPHKAGVSISYCTGGPRGVWITKGCLLVSICFSVIAYMVGLMGSRASSDAVQQRLVNRAWYFIFAELVTDAPNVVREFAFPGSSDASVVKTLAEATFLLGGLANTCVYVIHSHNARRMLRRRQTAVPDAMSRARTASVDSYSVNFREAQEVFGTELTRSSKSSEARRSVHEEAFQWLACLDGGPSPTTAAVEGKEIAVGTQSRSLGSGTTSANLTSWSLCSSSLRA